MFFCFKIKEIRIHLHFVSLIFYLTFYFIQVNSYSEKQCKSGHENEKLQPKKKEQENLIKRKNENESKNAVEKEQSVNTSGNMNLNYQKKMEEIMEATKVSTTESKA